VRWSVIAKHSTSTYLSLALFSSAETENILYYPLIALPAHSSIVIALAVPKSFNPTFYLSISAVE